MSGDNMAWQPCPCCIPCGWLNDLLTNYLIGGSSNLPPDHVLTMLIKTTAVTRVPHQDTQKVEILLK